MHVLFLLGAIALSTATLSTATLSTATLSTAASLTNVGFTDVARLSYAADLGAAIALSPLPPTQASVTGTVFYLPRIALPPNSVIEVELQDVSRQDTAAIVLGKQTIITNGRQVPFQFEIPYDLALVQEGNIYVIRAQIRADGQLLFASTSRYAVITNGHPNSADVQVDPVVEPLVEPVR
jgi:uncharacterized lipoprotein YbaY